MNACIRYVNRVSVWIIFIIIIISQERKPLAFVEIRRPMSHYLDECLLDQSKPDPNLYSLFSYKKYTKLASADNVKIILVYRPVT